MGSWACQLVGLTPIDQLGEWLQLANSGDGSTTIASRRNVVRRTCTAACLTLGGSGIGEIAVGTKIKMAIRTGAGLEETLEVPGPGGTLRVAAGRPGHSSGVWRIWATRTKSDVYVAARALAGSIKFSLHESGDWRHQWVTKARAVEYQNTENRVLDQWVRPPRGAGGWTRGLTIWIPGDDVIDNRDPQRLHSGVEWLPAPPPGSAYGIHVVLAETNHGFVQVENAIAMPAFFLADGHVVLVGISVHQLDEGARSWLDEQRTRTKARSIAKGRPDPGTRIAVFGRDHEGTRAVWDLAWG